MKICARCFGATIGHIISFMMLLAGSLPKWYFALGGIGILLVDWSVQSFFGVISTNSRRVITGVIGGFGVGVIIWLVIQEIAYLIIRS